MDLDCGLTNGACGEVLDFVLVTRAATMVGLSPPSPDAKLPLVAFDGLRDPVRVEVALLVAVRGCKKCLIIIDDHHHLLSHRHRHHSD